MGPKRGAQLVPRSTRQARKAGDSAESNDSTPVRPGLLEWLREVSARNLILGPTEVDLRVRRNANGAHELDVLGAHGVPVEIDLEP